MNFEEKKKLAELIAITAFYYDRKITPEILSVMVEDLQDLDFFQVCAAYQAYRKNSESRAFPMPGAIRSMLKPAANSDLAAREIAGLIITAVRKFGYTNADRAEVFVGEIGWEVVRLQGGWQTICEMLAMDNTSTFQGQFRELAKSVMLRSELKPKPETQAERLVETHGVLAIEN